MSDQDKTTKERVKEVIESLSIHVRRLPGGSREDEFYAVSDVLGAIEALEPIAESRRSEAEIRAAIKTLSTKYSSKRGVGETIAMAEYCLGKDNYLGKLFAPSGSNQGEEKEESSERG